MGLRIEEFNVTPELAAVYLEKNVSNRKLSRGQVLLISKQMQEGKWKKTGDTIKFSVTGRLLDGQHRLSAIVDSGVSQFLMVARGLDSNAFDVLDTIPLKTAQMQRFKDFGNWLMKRTQ